MPVTCSHAEVDFSKKYPTLDCFMASFQENITYTVVKEADTIQPCMCFHSNNGIGKLPLLCKNGVGDGILIQVPYLVQ